MLQSVVHSQQTRCPLFRRDVKAVSKRAFGMQDLAKFLMDMLQMWSAHRGPRTHAWGEQHQAPPSSSTNQQHDDTLVYAVIMPCLTLAPGAQSLVCSAVLKGAADCCTDLLCAVANQAVLRAHGSNVGQEYAVLAPFITLFGMSHNNVTQQCHATMSHNKFTLRRHTAMSHSNAHALFSQWSSPFLHL